MDSSIIDIIDEDGDIIDAQGDIKVKNQEGKSSWVTARFLVV